MTENITNGQILMMFEDLKGQMQLLAEGQTAMGESLRSEIHGVRSELREFKNETNEKFDVLQKELRDFKSEMYDFRDEMYDFRKEMYDFRDETKENFATLFEYGDNVAQEEENNAQSIVNHEQRLSVVENSVLHDVKA